MVQIETLEKSYSQTNCRAVLNKKRLTIPNAAREGRDGGGGSTEGKARGLFGYSTRQVSQAVKQKMASLTGDR